MIRVGDTTVSRHRTDPPTLIRSNLLQAGGLPNPARDSNSIHEFPHSPALSPLVVAGLPLEPLRRTMLTDHNSKGLPPGDTKLDSRRTAAACPQ